MIDANVLLYAVNASAPLHARSKPWLDAALAGNEPIGFSWTVLLAFLRIASHPGIFPRPLKVDEATTTIRTWLAQPPAVVVEPSHRHVDLLAALLTESGTAGNLVNDAHLATLAIEHDAVLVSFDADFGRFKGLRWEMPGDNLARR